MAQPSGREIDSEQIGILLHEYDALRHEIVSTLDTSRQLLNLTFTLIGVFVAATPLIADAVVDSDLETLLLVLPLLFYLIAWTQIRYNLLVLEMGNYLRDSIVAKLNRFLGKDLALTWSDKGGSHLRRSGRFAPLILPIAGAHYAVPLLSALTPVAIYLYLAADGHFDPGWLAYLLLIANAAAFVYSVFWGVFVETQR